MTFCQPAAVGTAFDFRHDASMWKSVEKHLKLLIL